MTFPSFVQVAVDGAGKRILNILHSLTGNDYYQQVVALGDPNDPSQIAAVVEAAPTGKGLAVWHTGLTDTQLRAAPLDVTGLFFFSPSALTPSAPSAVSVGVASAEAVAANAGRTGLVLTNTSSARISIAFGATAVLDSGITLYPQGTFSMDQNMFSTGALNAIASAAASNLGVQEFT